MKYGSVLLSIWRVSSAMSPDLIEILFSGIFCLWNSHWHSVSVQQNVIARWTLPIARWTLPSFKLSLFYCVSRILFYKIVVLCVVEWQYADADQRLICLPKSTLWDSRYWWNDTIDRPNWPIAYSFHIHMGTSTVQFKHASRKILYFNVREQLAHLYR